MVSPRPIVAAAASTASTASPRVTVSVVSHDHGEMIQGLLAQLCSTHGGWIDHCIVTHNLPSAPIQPPPEGWPFRFTEVFNTEPIGFGANHNRAFTQCSSEFFCVLNPDVELSTPDLWAALVSQAEQPGTGVAYPLLMNADGTRQDNERETVTPGALLARHLLNRRWRRVDWVSAAFWLVPSAVYKRMGGFDEGFFMYCEDTDFCLRVRLAGLELRRADVNVVHHAMRHSRKPGRHLAWHVRSLLRLWTSPVLRRYQAALTAG
jgi:N-acetylglucosaminyl-diphospho-decaprenol L-rhamnosyltransferase